MHEKYMRLAIAIARRNRAAPFGAILIHRRTGEVVAEGLNRWQENPTWHGEIDAINRCAAQKVQVPWSELCLVTTAEPMLHVPRSCVLGRHSRSGVRNLDTHPPADRLESDRYTGSGGSSTNTVCAM